VYAECCARHLRTWFTDEATGMTPHLDYAQMVPGTSGGTSGGVLEGQYLLPAFDAAWFLGQSSHWSDRDQRLLLEWAAEFLRWLRVSKSGEREARARNNHGTLYDVQITHLALVTGDADLARKTVSRARKQRIARQIKPDGSQPFELARTQPFFYVQYNLAAMFKLATRAEHAGIDLWRYETDRGAGIRRALDCVVPHLEDPSRLAALDGQAQWCPPFYAVLSQAGRVYGDERYVKVLSGLPGETTLSFIDLIR
jgi:hypothetical protein